MTNTSPQRRVHDLAIIITRVAPRGVQLALSVVERASAFFTFQEHRRRNVSKGGVHTHVAEIPATRATTLLRGAIKKCVLFWNVQECIHR